MTGPVLNTLATWQTPTLAGALDAPDAVPYLLTPPAPAVAAAPVANPVSDPVPEPVTGALQPLTGGLLTPVAPAPPTTAATNPLVRCGCGRRTNADMLVDIRALSTDTLTTLGLAGVAFICDGCRSRLFRTGKITPLSFYSQLGAPAAVLARFTPASVPPAPSTL